VDPGASSCRRAHLFSWRRNSFVRPAASACRCLARGGALGGGGAGTAPLAPRSPPGRPIIAGPASSTRWRGCWQMPAPAVTARRPIPVVISSRNPCWMKQRSLFVGCTARDYGPSALGFSFWGDGVLNRISRKPMVENDAFAGWSCRGIAKSGLLAGFGSTPSVRRRTRRPRRPD
jgi:hypothetical protein